ncbi:MAG: DUF4340 domain-containing protein [Acidobacteria bacterium]|nr:DUF4340 domain-containing protein [Acidobacteriota bacterium]
MLGGKRLLILVGAFAALLAFVYFYEIRGKEERDKQETERSKLIQLKADQTTRVTLARRNEPPLALEKSGAQWRITRPIQASADTSAVDSLLQALAEASSTLTIDKPDPGKYGLKDPAVTVSLEEVTKSHSVRFGDKDFSGASVYASRENDPNVYLVSDFPYTKATQPVADFRDKTLLEFDAEGVNQIEIKRKSDTVLLKKQGDGWYLQQPFRERADREAVDGLVGAIRNGRIQSFTQESLEGLKQYGLDPPVTRLVLSGRDKKTELNLGAKVEENHYAYVPGRAIVFTVAKDISEKASQPADQFQSREVVRIDRDKVTRIEVQAEKGKWAAEKKGNQWRVVEPPGKDRKSFIEYRFFLTLEDLKAEKVLKRGSVSLSGAPQVVCNVAGGASSSFKVEIFKKGTDWYARSSQSDKIFKIAQTQAQALNEPVDNFLE